MTSHILLLIIPLAVILILLQWIMHCQAKRSEGASAPDTSAIEGDSDHAVRVYYFYSVTCGPCRNMKPIVDRLRETHDHLIKVDIAEHSQLARDFGVAGVPSFIVVQSGVIREVKLGRVSEAWLSQWLTR